MMRRSYAWANSTNYYGRENGLGRPLPVRDYMPSNDASPGYYPESALPNRSMFNQTNHRSIINQYPSNRYPIEDSPNLNAFQRDRERRPHRHRRHRKHEHRSDRSLHQMDRDKWMAPPVPPLFDTSNTTDRTYVNRPTGLSNGHTRHNDPYSKINGHSKPSADARESRPSSLILQPAVHHHQYMNTNDRLGQLQPGWAVLSPDGPSQNGHRHPSLNTPPANIGFLKEINRRAYVVERTLLLLKLLGWAHLLIALVLIGLEWAKVLLIWQHLPQIMVKLGLVLRIVYPVYVLVIGSICIAAGGLNRKGLTQLLLVASVATLCAQCVLPMVTPFAQSIGEAVSLSAGDFSVPSSIIDAADAGNPEAFIPLNIALIVRNLLICYAVFIFVQFVATLLTVYITAKLLHVQI